MDEKEAGVRKMNEKAGEENGEKETSCMAGKGTDWESWVTTKDLSIGRTPQHPERTQGPVG